MVGAPGAGHTASGGAVVLLWREVNGTWCRCPVLPSLAMHAADATPAAAWSGPDDDGGPPPAELVRAAQRAGAAVGIDPALLLAIAWRESGFDPSSTGGTSSAAGYFQFLDDSWLEAIRLVGPQHGLGSVAVAIGMGANGRPYVSSDAFVGSGDSSRGAQNARSAILALRRDPATSAMIAAEMLVRERSQLEAAFGRPVRAGNLYLAHVLGVGGAIKFVAAIQTTPSASSISVGGVGVASNEPLFRDYRSGRYMSVSEAANAIDAMIQERRAKYASVLRDKPPSQPSAASRPVEVAEAR
jgi:hypothetical protein